MLGKFVEDKTPLAAVLSSRSKLSVGSARVEGTLGYSKDDDGRTWLVVSDDKGSVISFLFADLKFSYGDSREAPSHLRESTTQRFSGVLSLVSITADVKLALFEPA